MFQRFRILVLVLAVALPYSFLGSNRSFADGWTGAPVAGNPGMSIAVDGKAAGFALGSVYQNSVWPNSSKPFVSQLVGGTSGQWVVLIQTGRVGQQVVLTPPPVDLTAGQP